VAQVHRDGDEEQTGKPIPGEMVNYQNVDLPFYVLLDFLMSSWHWLTFWANHTIG